MNGRVSQAESKADAEERAFTRPDEGRGQRPEVRFADEPAERSQGSLRSARRLGDRVNGSADQRPSRERQGQRAQSARGGRQRDGAKASATARARRGRLPTPIVLRL